MTAYAIDSLDNLIKMLENGTAEVEAQKLGLTKDEAIVSYLRNIVERYAE